MLWLLWSKGLTKGPIVERVLSQHKHLRCTWGSGKMGTVSAQTPSRTSPQGPCTNPQPRDAPAPRADFKADLPLGREAGTSPCSAELKARTESLHTHKKREKSSLQRNLSLSCPVLWWVQGQPWGQGQPLPCSFLPREQSSADPSETCSTPGSGLGRGNLLQGTMTVYSADHKPNPLWFLIGIWAKLI